MNIVEKLCKRPKALQALAGHYGVAHHMILDGEVGPRMLHKGRMHTVWCLNDYLGLMNAPGPKRLEADTVAAYGSSYPHAARMTLGNSEEHEQLERELAEFAEREKAYLLNLGYAGITSMLETLVDRNDVLIYDQALHACGIDGVRMHRGTRMSFRHNDLAHLEHQLQRATATLNPNEGYILVVVDGVYSMRGDQAPLREIAALQERYGFGLMVDDSHGFGVLGEHGRGTAEAQGCEAAVDIYVSTFTKALGTIGAFVAGKADIVDYLRYNTRSQIFSRAMPLAQVRGATARLRIMRAEPERRATLWENTRRLHEGLRAARINIGTTSTPVTPVFLHGDEADAIRTLELLRERFELFTLASAYPVVPAGTVLLRMIPTALHSTTQVEECIDILCALSALCPEYFPERHQAPQPAPRTLDAGTGATRRRWERYRNASIDLSPPEDT